MRLLSHCSFVQFHFLLSFLASLEDLTVWRQYYGIVLRSQGEGSVCDLLPKLIFCTQKLIYNIKDRNSIDSHYKISTA